MNRIRIERHIDKIKSIAVNLVYGIDNTYKQVAGSCRATRHLLWQLLVRRATFLHNLKAENATRNASVVIQSLKLIAIHSHFFCRQHQIYSHVVEIKNTSLVVNYNHIGNINCDYKLAGTIYTDSFPSLWRITSK